jgi:hypothetical protein
MHEYRQYWAIYFAMLCEGRYKCKPTKHRPLYHINNGSDWESNHFAIAFFAAINSTTDVSCELIFLNIVFLVLSDRSASHK